MCTASLQKGDIASFSILSFHLTMKLLCHGVTLQNKYSSEYTWGKLSLDEDGNFSFTHFLTSGSDLWALLKPELI